MIGLSTSIKWGAALAIITILGFGINRGYNYHLDQIDKAVNAAKQEFALDRANAVREREKELEEIAKVEKDIIESQLRYEKMKVTELRRMLLIEHDLDQLLQKKPGLILTRVNEGTEAYFKELEDVTQ